MCVLKDRVEAELTRAVALHIKYQGGLRAQFRTMTSEGDYRLSVMVPLTEPERSALFARLRTFMAWKQATAFTMVCELAEPDCVAAFGVSYQTMYCCCVPLGIAQLFTVEAYGEPVWLADPKVIGEDIRNLLPRGAKTINSEEMHQMKLAFGPTGDLPAVHIAAVLERN